MTTTTPERRRVEYMSLDDIAAADTNPKEHNLPVIRALITRFGVTTVGVIDDRTGRLVAGHGRLTVLRQLRDEDAEAPGGIVVEDGRWLAPLTRGWSSGSDAEAQAYLIGDNRSSELGGWDGRMLAEVLDGLADTDPDLLTLTGYTADDLDDLLHSFEPPPGLDTLAETYGEPGEGDLWPVLRFKIPPSVRDAFYRVTGDADDDSARFIELVRRAQEEGAG